MAGKSGSSLHRRRSEPVLDAHGEIGPPRLVNQPSHAHTVQPDAVETGQPVRGHAAARLQQYAPIREGHSPSGVVSSMLSSNCVRARVDGLLEFVEISTSTCYRSDRLPQPCTWRQRTPLPGRHDVILLDQDRIVGRSMIGRAPIRTACFSSMRWAGLLRVSTLAPAAETQ